MIPESFCQPAESKWFVILAWTVLLVLLRWKWTGPALRPLNTMFHETGHAIMTLLFSGKIVRINLFSDSGVAYTAVPSWLGRFMVSLAGYPFASMAAWTQFYLFAAGKQHLALYLFMGVAGINLLCWVRNAYGIVWIVGFLLLNTAALWFGWNEGLCLLIFIYNSILLLQSVWTALVILYISGNNPASAGDASNLRNLTFLPPFIWGLFFALFAMATASDICARWVGFGYGF